MLATTSFVATSSGSSDFFSMPPVAMAKKCDSFKRRSLGKDRSVHGLLEKRRERANE
jgi:hypothetical protein